MQNLMQHAISSYPAEREIGEKERSDAYPFPLLALIFTLLMVLIATTGCTAITVRDTASNVTRLSDDVLFFDDFSDPPSGWGIWKRDGASVEYFEEGLRIQVNEPQYDFWSVAGLNFEDVSIEVDASNLAGLDDNDFGIICRYQDKENFYMMVVSSDGYYGIAKLRDGQYGMIGAQQLQYNRDAIRSGKARNHLRADCIGSTLRLYANGQLLMEASDEDLRTGDVGVVTGSYDARGVDILFDNFVVKKP